VYDATGSFLASLLHVNSSCASRPASSRPSLTWTRPSTPTPSSLIPHTTSTSSDSPSSHTPHNPHSPQPSSLPDAEAAPVGAAVGAALAAVQSPPWACDGAHEAGQQAAGLPAHREARARRVVSAVQGRECGWVVSAGRGGGRVVSAGRGGGRVVSAGRGGGRVVSAGRGGGRVVSAGAHWVVSAGPSVL
ncbi:unnamed protein product, partial [Closterium sp. Naga37s-1]